MEIVGREGAFIIDVYINEEGMAKLTPNMTYRLQRPIWIGSGGSGERCFHEKACLCQRRNLRAGAAGVNDSARGHAQPAIPSS